MFLRGVNGGESFSASELNCKVKALVAQNFSHLRHYREHLPNPYRQQLTIPYRHHPLYFQVILFYLNYVGNDRKSVHVVFVSLCEFDLGEKIVSLGCHAARIRVGLWAKFWGETADEPFYPAFVWAVQKARPQNWADSFESCLSAESTKGLFFGSNGTLYDKKDLGKSAKGSLIPTKKTNICF